MAALHCAPVSLYTEVLFKKFLYLPHPGQPESLNGPHSDSEKTKCKICGAFILKVLFLFHVGTSTSEVMGNDFFVAVLPI